MSIVEKQRDSDDEFEVFVYPSGGTAVEVKAQAGDSLRDVLSRAGVKPGDDVAAFIAQDIHGHDDHDSDDPEHEGKGLEKTLRELGVCRGGRIVHSHCRWVEVTVNYYTSRRSMASVRVLGSHGCFTG